ncbi:MAG: ATP-binding protein [Ignavibacteriae bacterium]|nr:ATP-binding protein [Ignavibacteriota bacterium]
MEKISVQLLSRISGLPILYRECSFENFIVHDKNRKVFSSAYEYALNPEGSITISGNTGSGKTHLAASIAKAFPPIELSESQKKIREKEIKQNIHHLSNFYDESYQQQYESLIKYYHSNVWQYRPTKVIFLRTIRFLIELNEAANYQLQFSENSKTKLEFLEEILTHDCIVLDDLGSERLSEAARQNIYFLIDECYIHKKFLVITTNDTIDEINEKEPRIASRLASGRLLYLNAGDNRLNKQLTKNSIKDLSSSIKFGIRT